MTSLALNFPALVIVDVQRAFDDPSWGRRNNPQAEKNMARLLGWRRKLDRLIVHLRHDSTEPGSTYRPGQPGEPVVPKRTNNAFIGTDLATRLDNSDCDRVVYAGVITNHSVEANVRMSGNLGDRSFIVADATATVAAASP